MNYEAAHNLRAMTGRVPDLPTNAPYDLEEDLLSSIETPTVLKAVPTAQELCRARATELRVSEAFEWGEVSEDPFVRFMHELGVSDPQPFTKSVLSEQELEKLVGNITHEVTELLVERLVTSIDGDRSLAKRFTPGAKWRGTDESQGERLERTAGGWELVYGADGHLVCGRALEV